MKKFRVKYYVIETTRIPKFVEIEAATPDAAQNRVLQDAWAGPYFTEEEYASIHEGGEECLGNTFEKLETGPTGVVEMKS